MTVSKYEGSRSAEGLFQGCGFAEFTSGNTYSGEFDCGQMHGQGKYVWTDKLVYFGSFVNNRIRGKGVSTTTAAFQCRTVAYSVCKAPVQ